MTVQDERITAAPAPLNLQRRLGVRARRLIGEFGVLPILMIALVVYFGVQEPRFLGTSNILNMARQSTYLLIITMGQMLVLLTGGFDLSVGSVVALTSVSSALAMTSVYDANHPAQSGLAITFGIVVGLGVGLVFGLVNAAGVAIARVSPFIVTLGTASAGTGVALMLTGGVPVSGMPDAFSKGLGTGFVAGIPVPVYFTVVLTLAIYVLLNWTRIGRYLYAIGGNSTAARLSGVRVRIYLGSAYVLSGLLAAIAGILLTARVSSGEANLGGPFPLQSIAAAVIGGVSLRGGEGRVLNVVLGAIFLIILTNGMDLIRVESYVQMIALGALLILAVIIDRLRERLRYR